MKNPSFCQNSVLNLPSQAKFNVINPLPGENPLPDFTLLTVWMSITYDMQLIEARSRYEY
jgi:hypothetical protein